ncbi:hypothetical protein [Pleionea litopenaei]|uniref:Uncharacterized protein n=1 Tax=Pleionea litopenaei TaxID=3070815 RepID=A0AA51RWG6_9GAMM|nr:hypothetical protein [Pleionea sp. HL-JVS1]WMS88923.1 hypothetical protein Q9312_08400 [Pleionea sp. HL-JVS1]
MESKAANTLVKEVEKLKKKAKADLSGNLPAALEHLFSEDSLFFDEEILTQWRRDERFDELIEYVSYQYDERGGEEFWKQVLLDLRLKKEEKKALKLLDGLLPGRMKLLKAAKKNLDKFPGNYLSETTYLVAKGEVLKVLYEYAFIIENKPAEQVNKSDSEKIKKKIQKILNE